MKLERERDIPVFKGKTWREQIALRDRAKIRDNSIIWLELSSVLLMAPIILFCDWLRDFIPVHGSVWAHIVFIFLGAGIGAPALIVFRSLFITPKIRRALESEPRPVA